MKFRKKPVVIEAMQWDGTAKGAGPIIDWALDHGATIVYECSNPERCVEHDGDAPHALAVRTLEGTMRADVGDWVIKGIRGEFYPIKGDIFSETYEAVESE